MLLCRPCGTCSPAAYVIIRGASLINESGRVNAYINEAGIDV